MFCFQNEKRRLESVCSSQDKRIGALMEKSSRQNWNILFVTPPPPLILFSHQVWNLEICISGKSAISGESFYHFKRFDISIFSGFFLLFHFPIYFGYPDLFWVLSCCICIWKAQSLAQIRCGAPNACRVSCLVVALCLLYSTCDQFPQYLQIKHHFPRRETIF